jgi:uncharacterized protein with FMN-binding domain
MLISMTALQKKHAITAFAALTLSTALAGCTSDSTASGDYADGTYTESGSYQAPSGTEEIEVTVTLVDNVITEVSVEGKARDPQAKQHQGEFIEGIAAEVVGKSIDELDVDKVGGSSLTSKGFTKAINAIKADAAS